MRYHDRAKKANLRPTVYTVYICKTFQVYSIALVIHQQSLRRKKWIKQLWAWCWCGMQTHARYAAIDHNITQHQQCGLLANLLCIERSRHLDPIMPIVSPFKRHKRIICKFSNTINLMTWISLPSARVSFCKSPIWRHSLIIESFGHELFQDQPSTSIRHSQ